MDTPDYSEMQVQRLTLQKIHMEYVELFDRADRVRMSVDPIPQLSAIQHRFATYVMGLHSHRIDRSWPRDWKQAFKERWAPRWWKRRYPVQYESIHTDIYKAVCPHIEPRDQGSCVEWLFTQYEE